MRDQIRTSQDALDQSQNLIAEFIDECVSNIASHADARHEALRDALLLARTNEGYGDHLAAVEAREIALTEALGLLGVKA